MSPPRPGQKVARLAAACLATVFVAACCTIVVTPRTEVGPGATAQCGPGNPSCPTRACATEPACVGGTCRYELVSAPDCDCYEGDEKTAAECQQEPHRLSCVADSDSSTHWECSPGDCVSGEVKCREDKAGTLTCTPERYYANFSACKLPETCESGGQCGCACTSAPTCEGSKRRFCKDCISTTADCSSGCSNGECNICVASPEICNGADDDCNGAVDEMASVACTVPGQQGDCASGMSACASGQPLCNGPQPVAEVCDGRDNNCNGKIDDLPSVHTQQVTDAMLRAGWGASENRLSGSPNCAGGTRVSRDAVNTSGGNAHCEVVDWANVACEDPNRRIGNSNLVDVCRSFRDQGGQVDGSTSDCRFIVHLGTGPIHGIECQPSHVIQIQDRCP